MENVIQSETFTKKEIAQAKEELHEELQNDDDSEVKAKPSMEASRVVIPDQLVVGIVRLENALICAHLTRDCGDAVKELARKAVEPTKEDIQVAHDFFQKLMETYAPRLLQGKNADLWMLGGFWATNAALKYNQVAALVKANGGKK